MKTGSSVLNKKLELIQWLSSIEDSSLLDKIIALRKSENEDWWKVISDEEKLSIDRGLEDAENGKVNPHSSARKLYEKWL